MPLYFNGVAPYCPISKDGPAGGSRGVMTNHSIPLAVDLPSALNAANLAANIATQLTVAKVINNVYTPPPIGGGGVAKDKNKNTVARWVEQTSKRVKRKYKYYAVDDHGEVNKDSWVITERIERMVWYDRAWKSYLTWNYGDKGEGEPVS